VTGNQQNTKRRVLVIRLVGLVIGVVVITIGVLTVWPKHWSFESVASFRKVRTEVPEAQARWAKHAVVNYDIDYKGVMPLRCLSVWVDVPRTLHIRNGQVQPSEIVECDSFAARLLPPKGLNDIQETLGLVDTNQNYLKVTFDADYGFISEYEYDCNSNNIGDCYVHYVFSNFRPIQP